MSFLDAPSHWPSSAQGTITLGTQPVELRKRAIRIQPPLRNGLRPADAIEIPFEAQLQNAGERMCGAAALAMVLHGLQDPCTQAELWTEIAYPDQQGELAARTFNLATAALHRGLPSLVIQVRDPWQNLKHYVQTVPGIILNHRLEADSAQGHFSVLVDMNEESALLHDPLQGPRRLVPRSLLEELWQPARSEDEMTEVPGNILVGIGPRDQISTSCSTCSAKMPGIAACSVCGNHFLLQPASLLGCLRGNCPDCRWEQMFCPFCDAAFQPQG